MYKAKRSFTQQVLLMSEVMRWGGAKRAQLSLTSQEMLGSKNKNFTSYRPPAIGHNTMGLVHSSPFLHMCAWLHTRPIYTYTSNFKTRKAYQVQLGGGGYQRHRLL